MCDIYFLDIRVSVVVDMASQLYLDLIEIMMVFGIVEVLSINPVEPLFCQSHGNHDSQMPVIYLSLLGIYYSTQLPMHTIRQQKW